MNESEIVFIVTWAVLALVFIGVAVYAMLDDPWSSQSSPGHVSIAIIMSVVLVACCVAVYVSPANMAFHNDTSRQLAKSYQSSHSDEKPVTLNLDSDDANEPLPDAPAKDKVTKVFYTSSNGTVISGGQSDYREALKSDNPVYVFVKR